MSSACTPASPSPLGGEDARPRLAVADLDSRTGATIAGAIASRLAELVRGNFAGPFVRPGPHWRYTRQSVGLLPLLAIAILGAGSAVACEVPEGFARLASPQAEIAYRWEPEELKVGRFFAAEVIACRAPDAKPVRSIVLDAQMPAHGHGMNYRPTATQTNPSRFQVSGLMLHMPGRWRLTVDLVQADRRTRLEHDIDLKP